MTALDLEKIQKASVVTGEHRTRDGELRERLKTTLHNGPSSIGDAGTALERFREERVMLHALKFIEGGKVGVAVGQIHDQPDHHLLVLEMVEKAAPVFPAVSARGQPMLCTTFPGTCCSAGMSQSSLKPMP